MPIGLKDISFPAMRFSAGGIAAAKNLRKWRLHSGRFFDRGCLGEGAFIVDRNCIQYEILAINKLRRSWDIDYLLGPQKIYLAEYHLSEGRRVTFESVRKLFIDQVVAKGWYRQGDDMRESFVEFFENTHSMTELISHVSLYGRYQF